jgi:hypothetical protein
MSTQNDGSDLGSGARSVSPTNRHNNPENTNRGGDPVVPKPSRQKHSYRNASRYAYRIFDRRDKANSKYD